MVCWRAVYRTSDPINIAPTLLVHTLLLAMSAARWPLWPSYTAKKQGGQASNLVWASSGACKQDTTVCLSSCQRQPKRQAGSAKGDNETHEQRCLDRQIQRHINRAWMNRTGSACGGGRAGRYVADKHVFKPIWRSVPGTPARPSTRPC